MAPDGGPRGPGLAIAGPVATGVGSLPHRDVPSALDVIATHLPVLPHWPQLPRADPSEGMLRQALGVPDALLVEDRGVLSVAPGAATAFRDALHDAPVDVQPPGLVALVEAVGAGRFPAARAVKGQIAGPITVTRYAAARAEGQGDLRADLVARVRGRAVAQVAALRATGLPVLLVLDEPAPGPWTDAEVTCLDEVMAAVRGAGATAGLHRCAAPAARWPGDDDPSVVPLLDLVGDRPPAAVLRSWGRGGWLGAGLLPAARGAVREWQSAVDRTAASPGDLARRTLITPSCGLAMLDPQAATAVLAEASAVAAEIRARFGMPTPDGP